MPTILGIESTAHTFGVAVVKNGKILSNIKHSYTTESGGIIPTESAKHHREVSDRIYNEAILKAGIKEKDIDAMNKQEFAQHWATQRARSHPLRP